jgi:hypothetical protein
MTGYLARLKTLLAEDTPTRQTDRTDKSPSVSFVSDQGSRFFPDEAAIEERAGLAADRVPPVYLDAWARLNCQKPARVSEAEWRLALDDGGRFLDAWGELAVDVGWTSENLFSPASGLLVRLEGATVETLGADHVRLDDGRTIWRSQAMSESRGKM